jgi:hypothetical protein
MVAVLLMFLPKNRSAAIARLSTPLSANSSDRLADNFDFPKAVIADNVLEQMRYFRKRAPLAVV